MVKCYSCNKLLNKKNHTLECSRCQKVVHSNVLCTGLSAKQLAAVKAADDLEWTCNECNMNSSRRKLCSFIRADDDEDEENDDNNVGESSPDMKKLFQELRKEVSSIIT